MAETPDPRKDVPVLPADGTVDQSEVTLNAAALGFLVGLGETRSCLGDNFGFRQALLAALGATTGTLAFTAIVVLVVVIGRKMPR